MRKAAALSKPLKKPGTVWVEPRFEADVEYLARLVNEGATRKALLTGKPRAAHTNAA